MNKKREALRLAHRVYLTHHWGWGYVVVCVAATAVLFGCARTSAPPPMSYQFHYDNQGRLSGWTNGNGQSVNYGFDEKGRLTTIGSPDGKVTLGYDPHDNVTRMEDGEGLITYRYDAFDRLEEAVYRYSPEKRVLYEYDPLGRPAAIKVASATGSEYEVRYEYDILGNLLAVGDGEGSIVYTYHPERRQIVRRLPTGITTTLTYSPLGELLSIHHADASGQLIAAYEYKHDATGNVTRVREETAEGVKVIRYEWDQRGYLVALHQPDGSAVRYEYDAMGNRIARTDSSGTIRYEYDKYGRLVKAGDETYEYDRAGRLTAVVKKGKRIRLKWNAQEQVIEVRLPDRIVQYKYDYMGNLVRWSDGKNTVFPLPSPLAPPGFPLAEFDNTGNLTRSYLYGDALLGFRDASGQKRYFLEDGFSSIRLITDSSGRVVGSRDYSPFAEVLHQSGEQAGGFRTAGEWCDPVTQQWLIGGRVYDAERAGYLSPDPSAASLMRPDRLNRYAHACSAPGQFTSPRCNQTHGGANTNSWFAGAAGSVGEFFKGLPRSIGESARATFNFWKPSNLAAGFRGGWEFGEPTPGTFADQAERYGGHEAKVAVQTILAQALLTEVSLAIGGVFPKDFRVPLGRWGHIGAHELDPVTGKLTAALGRPHVAMIERPTWIPGLGRLLNKATLHLYPDQLFIDAGPKLLRALPWVPLLSDLLFPKKAEGHEPDYMVTDPIKAAQEDIGGVELSATGKFLGQLGHIKGLVYDENSDRLVLVGDGDVQLPPMDLSYFAVAEQLVSQGYDNIWFTLDPADPKNPRGKWMKGIWGPNDPPNDLPAKLLPGTPAGTVMFEADWLLKQYSFGVVVGEDGGISPRTCQVPGFKDVFTLGFERLSWGARQGWNRFWIVIGDVLIRRSGNALVINDVRVEVKTRPMRATSAGLQDLAGVRDPTAEEFAKFFEEHYDEFGQESPQFAQLKEWGKVFALVKWLHRNGIPFSADPEWVQPSQYVDKVTALSDQRERKKTYRRGNAIVTETRIVQLLGGDEVPARPVEIEDDGSAVRLAGALHSALKDQPSRPGVPIEVEGNRLMGIVLPLTSRGHQLWEKAKSQDTVQRQGVTYHLGPDRKVQYAEDTSGARIDYKRDSRGNLTGFQAKSADGWTATATSHSGTTMDLISPRGDQYAYRWNTEGYLSDVTVNGQSFVRCSYDPAQRTAKMTYAKHAETLSFDSADRLQTWTMESTSGKVGGTRGRLAMAYDGNGQVTQVQTDAGDRLEATYENGRVRSVHAAGGEVEYSWQDNERLASIRSGDLSVNYAYEGENLRAINVQRGDAVASATFEKGLLGEVKNLSGGRWSYRHDSRGALISVSDPTKAEGHYDYDADGRLTEVRLPGRGRLQYVYGRLASKDRQGKTPSGPVRLLAVNFLTEGQQSPSQSRARTWQTFPYRTAGLVGLGVLVALSGIWWWRRRQGMWW